MGREGVSATVAFSSLRIDCVGKFQAANIASFVHIMIFPDCFARLISTTSFDDSPIARPRFFSIDPRGPASLSLRFQLFVLSSILLWGLGIYKVY